MKKLDDFMDWQNDTNARVKFRVSHRNFEEIFEVMATARRPQNHANKHIGHYLKSPEQKSLTTEATGQSGSAGIKIRQQMAFVRKRQGPGDEGRGAVRSSSFCGSD
jgi:hypothetical protein